jgi:hypothetical protein
MSAPKFDVDAGLSRNGVGVTAKAVMVSAPPAAAITITKSSVLCINKKAVVF